MKVSAWASASDVSRRAMKQPLQELVFCAETAEQRSAWMNPAFQRSSKGDILGQKASKSHKRTERISERMLRTSVCRKNKQSGRLTVIDHSVSQDSGFEIYRGKHWKTGAHSRHKLQKAAAGIGLIGVSCSQVSVLYTVTCYNRDTFRTFRSHHMPVMS